MIYLDNASTTKCNEKSAEIIKEALVNNYFNPSSKYALSLNMAKKLDECRLELLKLVGANDSYGVVFTGSATEANNLVLSSSFNKHKKNLISAGEHASIYETAKFFKSQGVNILEAPLNKMGEVDLLEFKRIMTPDTAFVTIMLVSNETGAINNIKELVQLAKKINPRVLFHVDAVQGFCKIKINMLEWGVDYLTLSSHKVEGPKGVGCLIYKKQAKLEPEILGGGQENGKRSGTENLPSILGFVNSAKELSKIRDENFKKVKEFKQELVSEMSKLAEILNIKFIVNGDINSASPYILSCGFIGTKGEILLHALESQGILVGTGSACNSKHSGNRILTAMGKSNQEIECNIRLSFSRETVSEDVKQLAKVIVDSAKKHNNS